MWFLSLSEAWRRAWGLDGLPWSRPKPPAEELSPGAPLALSPAEAPAVLPSRRKSATQMILARSILTRLQALQRDLEQVDEPMMSMRVGKLAQDLDITLDHIEEMK